MLPGRIGHVIPAGTSRGRILGALPAALPYSEDELRGSLKDPWIVHFTTSVKPWDYESTHPFRAEWFRNLDETPYRGWRPKRSEYLAGQASKVMRRGGQWLAGLRSS